jgi:hypothetical protein
MLLVKIFLFGWVILVILAAVYWLHLTGFDPYETRSLPLVKSAKLFFPRASLKSTA